MTASTEGTIRTLLRYEQGRRSYAWSKHNTTIRIQGNSEMLSQIITDSLQHTRHQMSFDQIHLPSAPDSADLAILALSWPNALPMSPSPEPVLPGKSERSP